jgi:hypothetical protein
MRGLVASIGSFVLLRAWRLGAVPGELSTPQASIRTLETSLRKSVHLGIRPIRRCYLALGLEDQARLAVTGIGR